MTWEQFTKVDRRLRGIEAELRILQFDLEQNGMKAAATAAVTAMVCLSSLQALVDQAKSFKQSHEKSREP